MHRSHYLAAATAAVIVALSASSALADDREDALAPADAAVATAIAPVIGLDGSADAAPIAVNKMPFAGFAPRIGDSTRPRDPLDSLSQRDFGRANCDASLCGLLDARYEYYNPSAGKSADNWGISGIGRYDWNKIGFQGSVGYNRTNGGFIDVDDTRIDAAAILRGSHWVAGPTIGYDNYHSDFGVGSSTSDGINYGAFGQWQVADRFAVGGKIGGFDYNNTDGFYWGFDFDWDPCDDFDLDGDYDYTDFNNGGSESDYTLKAAYTIGFTKVFAAYTRSDFSNSNFDVNTYSVGIQIALASAVAHQLAMIQYLTAFRPLQFRF